LIASAWNFCAFRSCPRLSFLQDLTSNDVNLSLTRSFYATCGQRHIKSIRGTFNDDDDSDDDSDDDTDDDGASER
jgi:hypothetical protein